MSERETAYEQRLEGDCLMLKDRIAELEAYADKLAAGLPEGMLPKDVELLRQANREMATELSALKLEWDDVWISTIPGLRAELKAALKRIAAYEREWRHRLKSIAVKVKGSASWSHNIIADAALAAIPEPPAQEKP